VIWRLGQIPKILRNFFGDLQIPTRLCFRCLIPGFDGALFTPEWRDAPWANFYTAAPRRPSSRRFGPARKTLPVYRQDIFDERIEFGFPDQLRRKLIVRDQMRGQNPSRFTSMRRIAPAPIA
jgi:hypothetical protein